MLDYLSLGLKVCQTLKYYWRWICHNFLMNVKLIVTVCSKVEVCRESRASHLLSPLAFPNSHLREIQPISESWNRDRNQNRNRAFVLTTSCLEVNALSPSPRAKRSKSTSEAFLKKKAGPSIYACWFHFQEILSFLILLSPSWYF